MAASASKYRVPVLLMTVASNWEWRGRSDLPQDWMSELVGPGKSGSTDALRDASKVLDERVARSSPAEAHEWLYRRAVVERELGEDANARADYRAAMNADPHLRRALDAMNARVEAVAKRRGCAFLDTVALLSAKADGGIVGFGEFYDYVHFTPRGALLVAAGIFRSLRAAGLVADSSFDPEAFAREGIGEIERCTEDALEVGRWLGFSFDRSILADRDLWKYDRMLGQLDQRIASAPSDFRALVYRGNARSFRLDGAAGAEADYRAALRIRPEDEIVLANLRALLDARPVGDDREHEGDRVRR